MLACTQPIDNRRLVRVSTHSHGSYAPRLCTKCRVRTYLTLIHDGYPFGTSIVCNYTCFSVISSSYYHSTAISYSFDLCIPVSSHSFLFPFTPYTLTFPLCSNSPTSTPTSLLHTRRSYVFTKSHMYVPGRTIEEVPP